MELLLNGLVVYNSSSLLDYHWSSNILVLRLHNWLNIRWLDLLFWRLLRHLFLNLLGLLLMLLILLILDLLLVSLQVTVEVELGEEASLAELACESLLALVDLQVLVQVGLLSERVATVAERTLVRPLLSVDAQVIEEVVPFAEHLRAFRVCAAQ